jgi:hypothetical protein
LKTAAKPATFNQQLVTQMSLINDALKQARKTPTRTTPTSLPPLSPAASESSPVAARLLAVIVIVLIVAAIFFIGWAEAHHAVRAIVAAPGATQSVAAVSLPVAQPPPVAPPPPLNPPDAPKLQAIFYMPKDLSAIIDGKTVRVGDQSGTYRVKEISKYTVTLVGTDKKEIRIGMGN